MLLVLVLCLALLNITQTTSTTVAPKKSCPEDGIYFAIPGNCSLYGVCQKGEEEIFSCPERLHFDSLRKKCTLPAVAGCEKASSAARHANIVLSSTECPEINPGMAVLLPHESDCELYYMCESGVKIEKECPDNLHFNPKKKVCDFPNRAGCQKAPSSPRRAKFAEASSECPEINPGMAVLLPHESDCELYYMCESGVKIEKECPDKLHFNPKKKVCDFPNRAGCQTGKDGKALYTGGSHHPDCPERDPKEPVIISHESDCSKFYICSGGLAYEKTCMIGLHFNPKLRVCDYPYRAKCPHASMELAAPEATGFPSPFCPVVNGKFPIFFPHPTDCSMYYMCGNGLAYEFTCPSNLHFNRRKKVCDSPFRAGCLEDGVQS